MKGLYADMCLVTVREESLLEQAIPMGDVVDRHEAIRQAGIAFGVVAAIPLH